MSQLDEIVQKRLEQRQLQDSQALHQENLDAISSSGNSIVSATDKLAQKGDIDKLISELKELQLTSLLQASKPTPQAPMNITDSAAYVGDSITKLGDTVMKKLNDSSAQDMTQKQLTDLHGALQTLDNSRQGDGASMAKAVKKLQTTLDTIDMHPVVNVPAPKVTVQAPKVDLQPLQDTLKEYFTPTSDYIPDKIDLDCYKAQDLQNDGNIQYVGFMNPDGNWYILENNVKDNSLRYIFGNSGYQKAFEKAASYEYTLLNEAVDALTT